MNRIVVVALIAFSLVGCATSKPVMTPSGQTGQLIRCGSARIDLCYEKAAEVCPKGYTVVADRESSNGVAVPVGGGFGFGVGPTTMFVECK